MDSNGKFEAIPVTPTTEQPKPSPEGKEAGFEAESRPETAIEQAVPAEEVKVASIPSVMPLPAIPAAPVKDAYHQRVERVLEDGLTDLYLAMPKERRRAFREEGERVSSTLRQMIDSANVKVKEVLGMIAAWLKMIPGVNAWFIEQEAKIKTDRVIALAEERRKEREGL